METPRHALEANYGGDGEKVAKHDRRCQPVTPSTLDTDPQSFALRSLAGGALARDRMALRFAPTLAKGGMALSKPRPQLMRPPSPVTVVAVAQHYTQTTASACVHGMKLQQQRVSNIAAAVLSLSAGLSLAVCQQVILLAEQW